MTKANYNYAIKRIINTDYVLIEDRNIGGMSVTNDIENVISDICTCRGLDPNTTVFLYRDSDGVWDGFDWLSKRFIHLGAMNHQQAVEMYRPVQNL